MKILVTGGAGYIGSHTCLDLLQNGHETVVVDNLCNASRESLKRVEELSGAKIRFYEADLRDAAALDQIFAKERPEAVIHFAGLKSVPESVAKPLLYYDNNINGTLQLFQCMQKYGVYRFVFSSSATVYGSPKTVPIKEDFPLSVTNPYGRTKLMIEDMLRDLAAADPKFDIVLLRYFNPIGADISGRIGEDPNGIPNNLVPYITQVIVGKREYVRVYGNDYPTPDGTGVRDYIHVTDLAQGHTKAIDYMQQHHGLHVFNLGTGIGYSVLDVIHAFEQVIGREIPYRIMERRPGDIATCYADPALAEKEMGWQARFGIAEMCADAYRWQSMNPDGYKA